MRPNTHLLHTDVLMSQPGCWQVCGMCGCLQSWQACDNSCQVARPLLLSATCMQRHKPPQCQHKRVAETLGHTKLHGVHLYTACLLL